MQHPCLSECIVLHTDYCVDESAMRHQLARHTACGAKGGVLFSCEDDGMFSSSWSRNYHRLDNEILFLMDVIEIGCVFDGHQWSLCQWDTHTCCI